ncbi:hypothetical protein [Qipengyuania huizhouensis]|uniref:hypothetical protein n=1 Tax=Qipengyuania huizhouensis TaxID=2867245 RepID=UPI001C8750E6|nr:hypothetical protein [Qipengyuania huizhouensis]MBX7459549.1 hypothetical protein [Qipengyuania huizhouensis]
MAKIKAILLKPLNGAEIGSTADFDKVDFDRLVERKAVKKAPASNAKAAEKPKNKKAKTPQNKAAPKPENKSAS